MAYMNQEKKKEIAAELKKFMPKDWKYSLRVSNNSSIEMTIRSAPVDLCKMVFEQRASLPRNFDEPFYQDQSNIEPNTPINYMWLENDVNEEQLPLFQKIVAALNLNNYNKSDVQSDYFDVGHYISLEVGRWNKPFVVK